MKRTRAPLFLKRGSYRKRRLRDGARMLPVLGLFLFLLPILWSPGETAEADTATDGLYLFAVWIVLVLVAALMAPGLAEDSAGDEGEER
ncbi:hypothetical protein [Paragemmobacter ruber]|uniref:Uncharacterized protein n=1 Tax=Paragemmobacter ruber TaxID=1985673 RepID=A0ABW9Y9R4_9RHOB|nr:hypothetical protein [Rhodobacter ruber]NBE08771.1 hypothetical protein [Rhodobacter ruber]